MIERSIIRFILGASLLLPMAANSATFSVVVITDSQFYAERHPEILEAQIDWIVANRVAENIVYVAQTGDLKDDQFCDDKTVFVGTGAGRTEWQIVDDAFTDLDTSGMAYAVLPGNHDFDPIGGFCPSGSGARPLTQYDARFGPARFAGDTFYGDPLALTPGNRLTGSNEDNFTLFESDNVEFIAINLAYRPEPGAIGLANPELAWADNLLKTYRNRIGILTSHYFMNTNDGGPDPAVGPYGQEVYDTLSNNRNLFMMLSGHWYGEAWRSEDAGRSIAGFPSTQIMMANYQGYEFPDDGDPGTPANTPNPALIDFSSLPTFRAGMGATDAGFMRIMRFDTDTGIVDIETFIPPVVPVKNRTGTIVSTYFPLSGAGMNEFTASNLSFSFENYAPLPGPRDADNDFIEDIHDNCPFVANGPAVSSCTVPGNSCSPEFQLGLIERRKQAYIDCLVSQGVPAQEANVGIEAGICTFDLFRASLLASYDDECGGSACSGIQEDTDGDGIGNVCE